MYFTKYLLRNRSILAVNFSTPRGTGFSHLADQSSFVLKLPEGFAEVKYVNENGVLNLHHTSVPEIYQGQGVGKIIAKNVLQYCLERNIKVKLTCEFLIKYCEKNQEFNKIIIPSD